ncbi:hypothetical protein NDU88_002065 [Pleurodeles waltl]|uniref:Uncharacterized protein n=1 Tax=Pleurodeles waltl TaxID=8319 RepID=A0AAV7MLL5_PLEWA|nr:hypothetical protein NDU88_002065 [Pleurodeles waltl]
MSGVFTGSPHREETPPAFSQLLAHGHGKGHRNWRQRWQRGGGATTGDFLTRLRQSKDGGADCPRLVRQRRRAPTRARSGASGRGHASCSRAAPSNAEQRTGSSSAGSLCSALTFYQSKTP